MIVDKMIDDNLVTSFCNSTQRLLSLACTIYNSNWRLRIMRFLVPIFTILLSLSAYTQSCIPSSDVKVVICPNKKDSNTICPKCYDCIGGLLITSSDFSIVSFKLIGKNLCGDKPEMEVQNTGSVFSEARQILIKACEGTILEFNCIRVKNKQGIIFIVQPLMLKS
jgi:hypothetical protein